MQFAFETGEWRAVGWYPAHVGREQARQIGMVVRSSTMLLHDFADHGPDADFSLENEWQAIGAIAWTKSVPADPFDDCGNAQERGWKSVGLERAKARFPNGVRLHRDFDTRLTEVLEGFYRHNLTSFRIGVAVRSSDYDIELYADPQGTIKFRNSLVVW